MKKQHFICAAVIIVFVALGFFVYRTLEIYPRRVVSGPSAEVLANRYFALERWLNETGRPVRVERRGSASIIAAAPERVIMVYSSAIVWTDAQGIIFPWIDQGGFLLIILDDFYADNALLEFLNDFGIDINNWQNPPELAEVPIGKGALTVIGNPRFMHNYNLRTDSNADLAWSLTGARTAEPESALASGDNPGVLFIRERYVSRNLFGRIMERGNLVPVIISTIFVIILGFWMVIPVFGLVFTERQKSSKPIRERFLAEIRFLKKHKALHHYVDVYKRELKITDEDEKNTAYNYSDIIKKLNKYRSDSDGTTKF